mmetsp:Transcript_8202/g.26969  ORF Transcript_8202/g.26969 Transcript_8202/m.26969 type:complete len:522 (+) Transcript_8202:728-2293(+)
MLVRREREEVDAPYRVAGAPGSPQHIVAVGGALGRPHEHLALDARHHVEVLGHVGREHILDDHVPQLPPRVAGERAQQGVELAGLHQGLVQALVLNHRLVIVDLRRRAPRLDHIVVGHARVQVVVHHGREHGREQRQVPLRPHRYQLPGDPTAVEHRRQPNGHVGGVRAAVIGVVEVPRLDPHEVHNEVRLAQPQGLQQLPVPHDAECRHHQHAPTLVGHRPLQLEDVQRKVVPNVEKEARVEDGEGHIGEVHRGGIRLLVGDVEGCLAKYHIERALVATRLGRIDLLPQRALHLRRAVVLRLGNLPACKLEVPDEVAAELGVLGHRLDVGRVDVVALEEALAHIPRDLLQLLAAFRGPELAVGDLLEQLDRLVEGRVQVDGGHLPDRPQLVLERPVPPRDEECRGGQGNRDRPDHCGGDDEGVLRAVSLALAAPTDGVVSGAAHRGIGRALSHGGAFGALQGELDGLAVHDPLDAHPHRDPGGGVVRPRCAHDGEGGRVVGEAAGPGGGPWGRRRGGALD